MADHRATGPAPGRAGRAVRLGAVATLAGAAAAYLAVVRQPPEQPALPDPRVTYAGPFQNVRPDARYVPDERCADCHDGIYRSYARHPMGRSLASASAGPHPPAGAEQNNPFHALDSQYQVEHADGGVWHRRVKAGPDGRQAAALTWEIAYTIGSGGRGHSYLTARDGYLLLTPVSWYSQNQRWDLSPGFGPAQANGRRVLPECLFCHVNQAEHVPGTLNRYADPPFAGFAIGCQRCHGPGELHVAARAGEGPAKPQPDDTIVNPRHLDRPAREAVCEQCHLQGEVRVLARGRDVYDYRPGLDPELFWAAFIRDPAAGGGPRKAVGHVEQMYQSRCFQRSAGPGALGCLSCHDPHAKEAPDQKVAHYRGRCLQCHTPQSCSVPEPARRARQADDSCVACHMPRYASADIPHTAVTDHRIPRRPVGDRPGQAGPPPGGGGGFPLVSFYRGRPGVPDVEDDRARAVAAVRWVMSGNPDPGAAMRSALPALEAACRRDPADGPAAEARANALVLVGRPADGLAAFEAVLAAAPARESALAGAAGAAAAAGRADAAVDYWRRAVAANPHAADYRANLVSLLVKQEAWLEAAEAAADWARLDPFSSDVRAARVTCLLALGDKAGARAEFAKLEALNPPNLNEWRIRFERRLR
jgi:Cytochrome c554 and c-prime